jgi:Protein of unknown function (DUF1573)
MKITATGFRRLICFSLCIGLVLSARAHPASNEMPFAGLVVLPEPHLRLTGRNQADFECGKINSLDHPQVEHRFTVRNEAEAPLAITQFEPTCHCTSAIVEKIAGEEPVLNDASVYYLLPGQEMVIKLTVQLARQPSGPMSHGVAIRVAGHKNPVARLHVTGEMEVGLMVTPSELDFGQMKLGETRSLTVTIQCDQRLLSGGALPRLVAQCDGTDDKTGAIFKIVPQTETPSANSAQSSSALRTKTYVATVKPKQAGDLIVRIGFASTSPSEYTGIIPYDRATNVFQGMRIDARGEVTKK